MKYVKLPSHICHECDIRLHLARLLAMKEAASRNYL